MMADVGGFVVMGQARRRSPRAAHLSMMGRFEGGEYFGALGVVVGFSTTVS